MHPNGIQLLPYKYDVAAIMKCLPDFMTSATFLDKKQLAITHSEGTRDLWFDGVGSLFDYDKNQFTRRTKDYIVLNSHFTGSYLETVINEIKELARDDCVEIGRIRVMMLEPKTCYTLHTDLEEYRLHIPLVTNDNCFFVVGDNVEKMQVPGNLYSLKTQLQHTAVNASNERRLHLVFDTY